MRIRPLMANIVAVAAIALFCSLPEAPEGPEDAGIDRSGSFRVFDSLGDTVTLAREYRCSVRVVMGTHLDSFVVRQMKGGADSVISRGTLAGDNFTFSWTPQSSGTQQLIVTVYKSNGDTDTLSRTLFVSAAPAQTPGPRITPDSSSYHFYYVDSTDASITVRFSIRDSGSNLWQARTTINDDDSSARDTVFGPKTTDVVVQRTLRGPELFAGLETPLVCRIEAIDADSLVGTSVCTVFVLDTVRPAAKRILPATDTVDQTPAWVVFGVTDNWGIDSATFDGKRMDLIGDTARIRVWTLDKGTTYHQLRVWDKAGNERSVAATFFFDGNPVFPPRIRDLDTAIAEGATFARIFLDSAVDITDPAPKYSVDSLRWMMTDLDTVPNTLLQHVAPGTHDSLRWFKVPVPSDPNWFGVRHIRFDVVAPGGLGDTRTATFFVTGVNDPPKITLGNKSICGSKARFDTLFLDTMAVDPDTSARALIWDWQDSSTHWRVVPVYTYGSRKSARSTFEIVDPKISPIQRPFFTRQLVIQPKDSTSTWTGIDSLKFTVSDGQTPPGTDSKTIRFSNEPCVRPIPMF